VEADQPPRTLWAGRGTWRMGVCGPCGSKRSESAARGAQRSIFRSRHGRLLQSAHKQIITLIPFRLATLTLALFHKGSDALTLRLVRGPKPRKFTILSSTSTSTVSWRRTKSERRTKYGENHRIAFALLYTEFDQCIWYMSNSPNCHKIDKLNSTEPISRLPNTLPACQVDS
jgi:hypothetical protein